jgi:hypothetical protein
MMNAENSRAYRTFAMTTHYLMNHAANLARKATGSGNAEVKQFTLDEHIARARHAAARVDAGYYFTDEELDDETLKSAPRRLQDDNDNEWL